MLHNIKNNFKNICIIRNNVLTLHPQSGLNRMQRETNTKH